MAKLKTKKLCRAFPLPFVKFTFKLVNVLRKQIRIWWSADANNRRKENFYGRKQELQASEDGEHHRLLFRRKSSFKQVCVSFENCVVSIATSSAVSYCDVCSRQIEPDWTADVEKVNPLAPTSGNLSVGNTIVSPSCSFQTKIKLVRINIRIASLLPLYIIVCNANKEMDVLPHSDVFSLRL
jgi:hypothetical protein